MGRFLSVLRMHWLVRKPLQTLLLTAGTFVVLTPTGCQQVSAEVPIARSRTLPNGIRLVSVYFQRSTNVSIFSYLPMGLVTDGPNQAQWSHLVEHLVIRSTINGALSIANAETLPDHMRLDFYGNMSNWKNGLSHQQRWLQGVPFDEETLQTERPKVKSEADYTAKNFATHKFAMAAWAQGVRHGQDRAAVRGDVDRASLTEIQGYRNDHLVVLSNIVVCVVGGVDPEQVFSVASDQFGTIRSKATPAAAVKLHFGKHEMTWDMDARHVVLTWPIPGRDKADFPALLVAAQRLNMEFFSDPKLQRLAGMTFAGADLRAPEGDFFYVSASLRPGSSFEEVLECLNKHLSGLCSSDADASWVPMFGQQQAEALASLPDPNSLKAQLPPNVSLDMLEGNAGLRWGMNEFRYGDEKAAIAKRLSELNPPAVNLAAKKYLLDSARSTITLQPTSR
jgi:predicted Zn-dependent peptidase